MLPVHAPYPAAHAWLRGIVTDDSFDVTYAPSSPSNPLRQARRNYARCGQRVRSCVGLAVRQRHPGDEYRLILDIESWPFLDGWFGDAGNLEVWMRQSDLDTKNFAAAWCLIRSD